MKAMELAHEMHEVYEFVTESLADLDSEDLAKVLEHAVKPKTEDEKEHLAKSLAVRMPGFVVVAAILTLSHELATRAVRDGKVKM